MSVFGQNLKIIRERAGLSQEALADRLGMLRTNYVKVETKGRAGDALIKKIAGVKELGVSFHQLRVWKAMDDYPELREELEHITLKDVKEAVEREKKQRGLEG